MVACGNTYTPAEQSRVDCHKFCRVDSLDAARCILGSRTPVIRRRAASLRWEVNVERTNLLVQDHHAIYDVSHCKYTETTYPAFSKKCTGQRLNIPNYSSFKLLGCPLILRLLSHKLFSNITVCKRSRLQFSIAVD
jgi:hypothetical protein